MGCLGTALLSTRRLSLLPPRPRAAGKWDATDTQWLPASCRRGPAPSQVEDACPSSPRGWCWPLGGTWGPHLWGSPVEEEVGSSGSPHRVGRGTPAERLWRVANGTRGEAAASLRAAAPLSICSVRLTAKDGRFCAASSQLCPPLQMAK